ncbi:MAG TPA: esterase family protein, partial [Reyranella sp.]
MTKLLAVLAATLLSNAAWAQPACVTSQGGLPAGANSTDKAAPFFIDTTGLDFKTAPPTRDPHNPSYPKMTELSDGTLPPAGAEG